MASTSVVLAAAGCWAPFVAFALLMVAGRHWRRGAAATSIAAVALSLVAAVLLAWRHLHPEMAPLVATATWLPSSGVAVGYGFLLDGLSLVMLLVVAAISLLVQVYSLGYMAGDPGFGRYFAFQSLFAWAMLNLCLAANMLQFYIFWELVGLSSYLLIGFWYQRFSASEAGKKAFVMTRLGDVAFFLGLLLLLVNLGTLGVIDINSSGSAGILVPAVHGIGALLIFGGIVGKSAQFPLLTWLPDAMEGPTPVSALLHSATMVAAGVYLFGRLFAFFSHAPGAMQFCLAVGAVSMLLAATMAMVARDIKQVWAYSTISQLGFMIMALAAGGYAAGIFHLSTHAGFKALLFLCSGVFIHACGSNDMYLIGRRGGGNLRLPLGCMAVAVAALSGIPPFSGFFSKELIMASLAELDNPVWLAAALLGALLTSYYSFRLLFVITRPGAKAAGDDGEAEYPHHLEAGVYGAMAAPLLVLAVATVGLGFFGSTLTAWLGGLEPSGGHAGVAVAATGLALLGAVIAWVEFGRRGAAQVGFVERIPPLSQLFSERWYLDKCYRCLLDKVVYGVIANACTRNDRRVIDGGIDGLCRFTGSGGRLLARLQSALVQHNLMVTFAVMAVVALVLLLA